MPPTVPLDELRNRFSDDQLKRLKIELNLLFSSAKDDLPVILLQFRPEKTSGLFLQVF